jgi:hypothetical protein
MLMKMRDTSTRYLQLVRARVVQLFSQRRRCPSPGAAHPDIMLSSGCSEIGFRFAQALLRHDPSADSLREEIVARWGRRALVSRVMGRAGAFSNGYQFSSRNRVNLDRAFVSVGKTIDHYEVQVGTAFRERLERLGHCTRVVINLLFPKEGLLYGDFHSPSPPTFSVCDNPVPLGSWAMGSAIDRGRRIPPGPTDFRRGPESCFCGCRQRLRTYLQFCPRCDATFSLLWRPYPQST